MQKRELPGKISFVLDWGGETVFKITVHYPAELSYETRKLTLIQTHEVRKKTHAN